MIERICICGATIPKFKKKYCSNDCADTANKKNKHDWYKMNIGKYRKRRSLLPTAKANKGLGSGLCKRCGLKFQRKCQAHSFCSVRCRQMAYEPARRFDSSPGSYAGLLDHERHRHRESMYNALFLSDTYIKKTLKGKKKSVLTNSDFDGPIIESKRLSIQIKRKLKGEGL